MRTIKLFIIACLSFLAINATATTYNNVFMAYYTPEDVMELVKYNKTHQLGGVIMWEFMGDTAYGENRSLLSSATKEYAPNPANPPQIMGYWSDWSVYAPGRAIPEAAYPVPGSVNNNGNPVTNPDFSAKLEGMNVVAYAFIEGDLSTDGTLYFDDPWSDLRAKGKDPAQDAFCNAHSKICWTKQLDGGLGNFNAFAKLQHANPQNPLGALKKIFSIGGAGHDHTFENVFNNPTYADNFVASAKAIVEGFNIDGIDLDYENPNMTHAQSQSYLELINKLRAAIPNKIIMMTIMSGPDFIKGTQAGGTQGFAPGVMKAIAAKVDRINLMTYDFHGAFDYSPGVGRTGFLTNLFPSNNQPAGYDERFSVQQAVEAALEIEVPAIKVATGIPAYSRALTGIDKGDKEGLFSIIPSTATVPRGNLDAPDCNTQIPGASCSGTFSYRFIVDKMLGKGFTETVWKNNIAGVANGATAYAATWTVPVEEPTEPIFTLQISNTGKDNPPYSKAIGISEVVISAKNSDGWYFFNKFPLEPGNPTERPLYLPPGDVPEGKVIYTTVNSDNINKLLNIRKPLQVAVRTVDTPTRPSYLLWCNGDGNGGGTENHYDPNTYTFTFDANKNIMLSLADQGGVFKLYCDYR